MNKSNNISISQVAQRCVIAFFVLISVASMAQTRGTLTVVKDARIDTLIAKRLELSKAGGSSAATINNSGNGYRVQFFVSSNRTEAYNAQTRFNELYPEYKTYIIYSEPNFKVRAGDFRTKLEATRLMEQLRGQFTSLFIIFEKINLPDTK
ncbi:SPOR domain-containing protein [Mucilaginibacter sp. HMF5004]|uniref:SPOR domain-containing protein n=1 Tax=Mucilaginibacter rivuli TaxID=2857527 RepID=UPI001C5E7F7E|nr:SPOR domain-containing protein [Mucilaginibacter rivuli]MBW4888239.1 SPOR domain-containing protein [Mucilaginibacter rivuli]